VNGKGHFTTKLSQICDLVISPAIKQKIDHAFATNFRFVFFIVSDDEPDELNGSIFCKITGIANLYIDFSMRLHFRLPNIDDVH
jgi:hypothetical protein